jgi:hypothetical protein
MYSPCLLIYFHDFSFYLILGTSVLNCSISRNPKEIWNPTKISATPGMYQTRGGSVQRPLTSGPRGWPASKIPWPANFYVSSDKNFVDTCLHEKGKAKAVKKVGEGQTHWPTGHVAWPPSHHLVSYSLGQVSGAPPQPYKYPLPVEMKTHTSFWRFHLQSSHS